MTLHALQIQIEYECCLQCELNNDFSYITMYRITLNTTTNTITTTATATTTKKSNNSVKVRDFFNAMSDHSIDFTE